MNKYKAVLFDYDGTLVDTNEVILESWRHTYMRALGRECEDSEVVSSFGESLYDSMVGRFPGISAETAVSYYHEYQEKYYEKEITLCEGMKELVEELHKRGYKLAIVTSRRRASTDQGLQKFGILDSFDDCISCDDTDAHKPQPEPILLALKRLGLAADEAIYIGDSKYDIQCAHNAGLKAVLCNWTICLPEELRVGENKPDFVIDKAMELLDIV